jgi:hypothetical protein
MPDCEKLKICPFFTDKMLAMPSVSNLMKQTYCLGDKMQCARYQVGLAGISVPRDLLPNDLERAREILRGPH